MVVARFYTAVDMSDPQWTYGDVTVASKSQITIDNGIESGTYYGSFSYDRYGYLVGGTVTAYRGYENGVLTAELSGGKFSAMEIARLEEAQTPLELYQYVFSGNDTLYGSSGSDTLIGFAGNDTIYGGSGYVSDALYGDNGNDYLDGGDGADYMEGGAGDDTYILSEISDTVAEIAGGGIDTVRASFTVSLINAIEIENLTLTGDGSIDGQGNIKNNIIIGNSGANILSGMAGNDTLYGGLGDDNYYVAAVVSNGKIVLEDTVIEYANQGMDTLYIGTNVDFGFSTASTIILGAYFERFSALDMGVNRINLTGNALNNYLVANDVDNILDGGLGADTLDGGLGDDIYIVDHVGDVILDAGGTDTVKSWISFSLVPLNFIEHLELLGTAAINATGNDLNNNIMGNAGNNILNGGLGVDNMTGGAGNDTYYVDETLDEVHELLNGGVDSIFARVTYTLSDNVENLTLTEDVSILDIDATGNAVANIITGNGGNNFLIGGDGLDTLRGGAGNDTYLVNLEVYKGYLRFQDAVIENINAGNDTVQVQYFGTVPAVYSTLILGNYLEKLDASVNTTNALLNLTGNALANIILGNNTANTIDGGLGADEMHGGAGDDIYLFDNSGDRAFENNGEGADTLRILYANPSKVTPIIIDMGVADFDYIENITITGAGLFNLTGNDLDNRLVGNAWNNTLAGGLGNDYLDGGVGADVMQGDDGDDIYIVDNSGDQIMAADVGTDTVQSYINFILGVGQENLTLLGKALNATGNDGDNILVGNAYNNLIDGGMGADSMTGGAGNDIYILDNAGDNVTELLNGGIDLVKTSVTYALEANIENLTLTGVSVIDGTGNALNNTLIGNDTNNSLDGAGGIDYLYGGKGDDVYKVDVVISVVKGIAYAVYQDGAIEKIAEGTDSVELRTAGDLGLVYASTLTMAANIESLDGSATGSNKLNFTGNALNNVMIGNAANNIMDGGLGIDSLSGKDGNDFYIFDNILDTAYEDVNKGTDTIRILYKNTLLTPVAIDMTNAAYDNIENIEITGTGLFDITGNDLDNNLKANAYVTHLAGGLGDDTYQIFSTTSIITEQDHQGTDTVIISLASGTYTLGDHLEKLTALGKGNLILNGNDLDNVITGNDGANTINGGVGADTLLGGFGNDTYVIDALDNISENANSGVDLVQAGLTYTLGANVENLTLTGSANIDGTGNALANVIYGNNGDNILNGMEGADALYGGAGNDIYHTEMYAYKNGVTYRDLIVENAASGIDTLVLHGGTLAVTKATGLVLGANFENMDIRDMGSTMLNIAGNASANILHGNDWGNILSGGAGSDTLSGEGGVDYLYGGLGTDIFAFNASSWNAVDVIKDFKIAENDAIDISDLLVGYDGDPIHLGDFVSYTNNVLSVDRDGTDTNYGAADLVSINPDSGLTISNIFDHLITTA